MNIESPEEVLGYILRHVPGMPARPNVKADNASEVQQKIRKWFDGRLAADFDFSDFFMLEMIVKDTQPTDTFQVPPAAIFNNDAYIRDFSNHAVHGSHATTYA